MSESYDILFTNALVYDRTQNLRGVRKDVAIADGKVAAIGDKLDPGAAKSQRDLAGLCLSPGWIDIHVHGYGGLTLSDIQSLGVRSGVTACVDAGDFGTLTYDDFAAIRADSIADMYGYVHMHPAGIPYTGLAQGDYSSIPVGALTELIGSSRGVIKGMKLSALGDMPLLNLKVAKAITEAAGVPFYMHIGEVSNFPTTKSLTRQAVDLLSEGDIITHIYTGDFGKIIDENGRVLPEIHEARKRGIIFDVGHGIGNFELEVAERALEEGIEPDVISSDHNALCIGAPSDLATTMSKFLTLGLTLDDIIAKVTAGPKSALGLPNGSLAPGSAADMTIFHVENGDFEFATSTGSSWRATRRVVPDFVLKNGHEYGCDPAEVLKDPSYKMVIREPSKLSASEFSDVERKFLCRVLRTDAVETKSDALHKHVHESIDAFGLSKRDGLRTVYRMVFEPESAGFTPQAGWFLKRIGSKQLAAYREALQ